MSNRNLSRGLKAITAGISCFVVLPAAALAGFGRFPVLYTMFAHVVALVPGIVGDYLRVAYYRFTLLECSLASRISFGTFFPHREVVVGSGVYIGAYCVIGRCCIGDRTQIASLVQILSGREQHARDTAGRLGGAESGRFTTIEIGHDCWIGASSIVMANVGEDTTIGAGAVVVKDLPAGVVAVGNPVRILRRGQEQE